MIFIEGIKEVARRIGVISSLESDGNLLLSIKAKLNYSYKEIAKTYLWRDLERQCEIPLVKVYDTGTISVTQNSRTVTGSGTAWTSAMNGRYIKFSGASDWYKIANVASTGSLTLFTPVQESSASGLQYQIWKKFYRLPAEVRKVLPDELSDELTVPFEVHGWPDSVSSYSVSITTTQDSKTITGSSFFDNVYVGDELVIGEDRYTVGSIDSDTQITLLNYSLKTVTDTGVFTSRNPRSAVFDYLPSASMNKGFSYIKYAYDMVHDKDQTELHGSDFDQAILDFAVGEMKREMGKTDWNNDILMGNARLVSLEKNSEYVIRPYHNFKVLIKAGNGRG